MDRLGLDPSNSQHVASIAVTIDRRRNAFANKLRAQKGLEPIPFNATGEGFSPEFSQAIVDRAASRIVKDEAVKAFTNNSGIFGEGGQFQSSFEFKTGNATRLASARINLTTEGLDFFRSSAMRSRMAYALYVEQQIATWRAANPSVTTEV